MPGQNHGVKGRRGPKRSGKPSKNKANNASGKTEFSGQSKLASGVSTLSNFRAIPLFPARYRGLLRYQDNFNLVSTSGVVSSYVFSCNGLYDPNITGTGHQPAGFDQMMLSYEHYCVSKARIMVTFQAATANVYPTVAVSQRAASTPNTVIQQNIEDGLIITERLHPVNVANSVVTISMSTNIAQFGGVTKLLDNSDYRGNISSNPTEQSYFHVQTWSLDANTSTTVCEVVIEYESWFTEPRTLSQSTRSLLKQAIYAEEKKTAGCTLHFK